MMRAFDLFSAAAGGWSLGLHRAGFVTIAACEIVEWRRILYAENNPHVRLYEDVRGLTAARLVSDLGILPDIIVGSPPCQDISSANTKGKGIEGERSGLYLEAVRLVGDCRPRWFASPSNRAWWVLTMSAPTMSASGPGSSATILNSLPTPVSQSQQGGIRLEGGSGARRAMKESGLYDLFRNRPLPTPMASDGMTNGAGGGAGSTYPLRMILATPRKSDADRGGRGDVLSQLQGHASRHAGMMGTPTANAAPWGSVLREFKGRMTSDQDGFDRAPTMSEVLHFDRPDMPYGMMPTPVKPNGGSRLSAQEIETGKRANGAKAQIDTPNLLRHAAEILPTPTKRDSRMDGRGRWRRCCGAMG
jgi:hypothetical protein